MFRFSYIKQMSIVYVSLFLYHRLRCFYKHEDLTPTHYMINHFDKSVFYKRYHLSLCCIDFIMPIVIHVDLSCLYL